MKKALFLWGGWEGHEPRLVSELLAAELERRSFQVQLENALEPLEDIERLKQLDLIVPNWTGSQLSDAQADGLSVAVKSGVGLGGTHGMTAAFPGCQTYEWMTGGSFMGHPYVGEFYISLKGDNHVITQGMPRRFKYHSEQYYMLVDPAMNVLASTNYQREGRKVKMPVVWIKHWGLGRVFYSALGHNLKEFQDYPDVLRMTVRGLVWAAEGKSENQYHG